MPLRKNGTIIAAATLATLATVAIATPSIASAATATTATPAPAAAGCTAQPVRKAFSKFGDLSDYSLAPGGDFESASGWTLTGGAKIASGNENLGVAPGKSSLQLPLGATATSPQFCVDVTNPHFRFVSRPDNSLAGYVAIVLYRDSAGKAKQAQFTSSSAQSWGAGKWTPSSLSPLATGIALGAGATATVQIQFVSTGNKTAAGVGFWGKFAAGSIGKVSVDSLMIDPYRRG